MRHPAPSLAFTAEDASRITGVQPSTIRYWAGPRTRLIPADVADSRRQGSRKLFSIRNLVQIRVALLLSQAGWSQQVVAAELPEIFRPQMDWFNPDARVWGSVDWLLFADRRAWRRKPWVIMGIGAPGDPNERHAWLISGLSAHLGDFEVTTITWPNGWQPRGALDQHHLSELVGVRRLTFINLGFVKRCIGAAAFATGFPVRGKAS
jgi:hypothetical protein